MSERFSLSLQQLRKYRSDWRSQRANSKIREIPFLISFEDWLQVWVDSGKLHLKGCRKGQYVMARFGDIGPYSVDNVKIIPQEENHNEGLAKKPKSEEHRAKLSAAKRGKPSGRKGQKMSEAQKQFLRKPKSEETKKKLSEAARRHYALYGAPQKTVETRAKLSKSTTLVWARRRAVTSG